jgi:integrase
LYLYALSAVEGSPCSVTRSIRISTPYTIRTVLHIHRAFSKALKQAVAEGLIPRNPAAPVKPPQPRQEEIRPLNREQIRALFDAASGERLEALYIVAVTAGLRRGELQGLKWEDLDLEAGMLQVRRTLSEPKGGYIFEAPKSGKGRNIRLTKRAIAAIREHRKCQLEERLHKAGLWREEGLVFPSAVGTPLWGGNLNRAFKAMLQRAGLPKSTRFHDLRHTCATLLLKQGVNPKFVQELLGHADISLTLNVYSHVLPDMGDAAHGIDSATVYGKSRKEAAEKRRIGSSRRTCDWPSPSPESMAGRVLPSKTSFRSGTSGS